MLLRSPPLRIVGELEMAIEGFFIGGVYSDIVDYISPFRLRKGGHASARKRITIHKGKVCKGVSMALKKTMGDRRREMDIYGLE
jgi:hypothetical protein